MPALESLNSLSGIHSKALSREEKNFLEIELLVRIFEEIKAICYSRCKDYFGLMKFNKTMEENALNDMLIRFVVNDILSSGDYSIEGIASYTQTPGDIIYDIATGLNKAPSFLLSRKLIDLHRLIRADLYQGIVMKIKSSKKEEEVSC